MDTHDKTEKNVETEERITGVDTKAVSKRARLMTQRYVELVVCESERHEPLTDMPELEAIRELAPRIAEVLTLVRSMRETSDLIAYWLDAPKALRSCYLFSPGATANGWPVEDDKQSIEDAMETLGHKLDGAEQIDASGACLFVPVTVPSAAFATSCQNKLVVRLGHTTERGVHDTTSFEVTADGLVVPSAIMRDYPDQGALSRIYGTFPSRFDAYERIVVDAMSARMSGLTNGLIYMGKRRH